MRQPNPVLNEEELSLLGMSPEQCLRRVVDRGAISLEEFSQGLPQGAAAALQNIVSGERLLAEPGGEQIQLVRSVGGGAEGGEKPSFRSERDQWILETISRPFPQLAQMVEEALLSPEEAMAAVQAIDGVLGRYPTGTRYAAP